MPDHDPDLVLYGEDHLHAPDREAYLTDIEERGPATILLEELGGMEEDEVDGLIDLYDSFGTIERARDRFREMHGKDPLPDDQELYAAVSPDISDHLTGAYERVRELPQEALYGLAGISPGFGSDRPDDPQDLVTTPVYELDRSVIEGLRDAIDHVGADYDGIDDMKEFYGYLAVEQETLTRMSHDVYDFVAEQRRQGDDVSVAGCDLEGGDIDLDTGSDTTGILGPAREVAADLERENRKRESRMADRARQYVEDTDGAVAMVVGDGHLGYTGLENRLRFDDIDMEVHRSGQDHHRRREELAGLLYFRRMDSAASERASRRFADLLTR